MWEENFLILRCLKNQMCIWSSFFQKYFSKSYLLLSIFSIFSCFFLPFLLFIRLKPAFLIHLISLWVKWIHRTFFFLISFSVSHNTTSQRRFDARKHLLFPDFTESSKKRVEIVWNSITLIHNIFFSGVNWFQFMVFMVLGCCEGKIFQSSNIEKLNNDFFFDTTITLETLKLCSTEHFEIELSCLHLKNIIIIMLRRLRCSEAGNSRWLTKWYIKYLKVFRKVYRIFRF